MQTFTAADYLIALPANMLAAVQERVDALLQAGPVQASMMRKRRKAAQRKTFATGLCA